ncbi:MAG: T9SS type A sorting domain-containing protein, partial [Prevotellaceae bacterium]|nr:T9SS type A sorting domain-containing protein [Prevotellaceae bacterium]
IEKPEIYIDNTKNATAENIPSGREATFTLQLQNLSDANLPVTYQLSVGDNANRNGLILSIDGTPLTSPREYAIEYGEELVKTLKVRQSSVDILEYSGVTLLLSSTCDDNISSQAAIGVKYIPSSTDLKLVALNTLANVAEGASVGFRIAEYDRSFRNFAAIRLQYKNVNDHTWVTLREFINDTSLIPIAGNGQELIRSASITYTCDLQSLVDGEYDFRAISVALLGNDEVTASSEEIRIIKDMKAPQLLGNASPANGILTPESEISVLFNENIRSAYVKDGNISVKAILNGHKVAHATALKLSGGAPASTEAGIPLANRSFSLEAWFERALGQPGTLLAHGSDFSLGFTADDKVTVAIGGETFTSVDALTESGWQYIGFAYNSDGQAFSVYLLAGSETKTLFTAKPVAAPYAGSGRLLVGANADGTAAFTGAVHNLSLWNSNRLLSDLSDKDQAKTGAEKSLAGYWPLTEGHGAVAADKARSRHLSLPNANSWYLRNVNKAVAFDGSSYLALSAAHIPVTGDENFAVEFWFRGAAQAGAATLFSCGDGVLDSAPAQNLSAGFDAAGKLTLRANGESYLLSPESYLDNSWRHFALNVLRSGSAIAYVDGAAVKQLPASAIGQMAAESIVLGARRYRNKAYTALSDLYTTDSYFTGELDEIRIWKSARTADAIRQDIYNRLNGNEAGLQAYYPFEATYTDEYNQLVTSGTLEDCLNQPSATGLTPAGAATSVGSVTFSDQAPALKEARALENVAHTWTASNNKIVVNIVEPAYRIENTTLELTVSGILDLNDNPLAQPIAWTAYANMNRLRWSDDELAVSKEYLDEATREVAILNESGLEETWTLSGLPSWLTVSKTSGSIKPLSSEKLTFTVSASTPTGAYEEIIYLTGGSQIDAPLPVSLKVSAQTPDWGVSAADFEHSMSLIAQLTFEGGAPSKNPEDIVAAFIDGVCVGRASPAYYSRYDAGFVIFDIYGSSDMSAKTVTFKAWDAGAGRIYPAVTPSTPVTFVSNKLAGSMSSPVTLNGENKVEQQTLLAKGWSWVSLSVRPADLSVGNAFASVKASVAMLKSKSAFSVPNGAAWAGDLQAVEIGKMYKVRLTEQRTLTLTGEEINPQQAPVTIKPQWSWIGYAPQLSLPLEDALADLSPSEGDLIKGQSRFATYTGGAWIGSLATLAPGKGYLYYSTAAADKQFRFPSAAAATPASPAAYTARSLTASRLAAPAATQWTAVSETKYAGNMTIIAVVKSGSRTLTSGEVGVFAGSECRAAQSCAPDGSGLLFITVAGDDPVQLTFKVYDQAAGATYSVQQTLTFGDDAAHGTISDPYVIQIRLEEEEATGIDRLSAAGVKVYPTVVSDVLHVESESVALHSISVYNVNGSLVRQLSAEGSLTATLSLASLPQGAYFVIVETKEGKTLTVQIIR